jgi:predicted RecA/RadA family phage recombinase
MARTFVQPGNTIDAVAPGPGGVKSGDVVVLGALVGVAEVTVAAGETYSLNLVGVHRLPKTTGGALEPGALAYWVPGTGKVAGAGTAGNIPIGTVTEHAGSDATEVLVRLNGISTGAIAGG